MFHKPTLTEVDWSNYFEGLTGTAIVYDPTEKNYMIYNKELALTQRSPCSTFKIISSLIGLENGIIDPDNSVRPWSGEIFWNEDWNRDINFSDAFRTSVSVGSCDSTTENFSGVGSFVSCCIFLASELL